MSPVLINGAVYYTAGGGGRHRLLSDLTSLVHDSWWMIIGHLRFKKRWVVLPGNILLLIYSNILISILQRNVSNKEMCHRSW